MKRANKSSERPAAASRRQTGTSRDHDHEDDDIVQALMRRYGIAMTRENYLDLAHLGSPPELDAEGEANLPPQFQKRG
jgi:hypothetical protein